MQNGTVKFFNAAKGFGFITPDEGGKDVFVAAASAASSGVPALRQGQRVSFETAPDGKGPKAVNLTVIANPNPPPQQSAPQQQHKPQAPRPVQSAPAPQRLTFYYDASSDAALDVLDALRDLGHEPRLVDYIATPPNRDALKNLSRLAQGGSQSLVHKYDPLFLELRLDDRFISENEFWDAIFEHPHLINGPIVSNGSRAAVCRTEQALHNFLGVTPPAKAPVPKMTPKLSLVSNEPAPAVEKAAPVKAAAEKTIAEKIVAEKAPAKPAAAPKADAEPKAAPKAKAAKEPKKEKPAAVKAKAPAPVKASAGKAKAAPKAKAAAKPKAAPKAKPAAKAKAPAKKPAKKASRK
jgi:CspA family cold shock protein